MKIFINQPKEKWICDRLKEEFYQYNPDICTNNIAEASVIWIMAPWAFRSPALLNEKKVLLTSHHITPNKPHQTAQFRFDNYINSYHCPSSKSKDQASKYTQKNISAIPWWINNLIWNELDKAKCREELELPRDKFIIGSFQRDTEGGDKRSPKLEKGPDQFCDIVEDMYENNKNIHILLGGWRRSYIINRLQAKNIPFTYKERPDFKTLNKMYNALDLYLVASRYEGGPQSIPECCASKTPIISTDVGCAREYLNADRIFDFPNYKNALNSDTFTEQHYKNSSNNFLERGMSSFIDLINSL